MSITFDEVQTAVQEAYEGKASTARMAWLLYQCSQKQMKKFPDMTVIVDGKDVCIPFASAKLKDVTALTTYAIQNDLPVPEGLESWKIKGSFTARKERYQVYLTLVDAFGAHLMPPANVLGPGMLPLGKFCKPKKVADDLVIKWYKEVVLGRVDNDPQKITGKVLAATAPLAPKQERARQQDTDVAAELAACRQRLEEAEERLRGSEAKVYELLRFALPGWRGSVTSTVAELEAAARGGGASGLYMWLVENLVKPGTLPPTNSKWVVLRYYHPDKQAGTPPEWRELCLAATQQINNQVWPEGSKKPRR
eukprot:jgi/Chrzof1/5845/Cz16g17280.t1